MICLSQLIFSTADSGSLFIERGSMPSSIIITYPSALQFWLDGSTPGSDDSYSFNSRRLADFPKDREKSVSKEIVHELAFCLGLSLPISLMVSEKTNRNSTIAYRKFIQPKNLPQKSFVKLNTNLYPALDQYEILIASPEYCFLCAAKDYPLCQLVEIGTNLCAIYVKDSSSSFYQRQRKPLVSQSALEKYVIAAEQMPLHRKSMIASKYVADNSRSPIESKLATICCLPRQYGGYGLKKPKLNYDVLHSNTGKKLLNRNSSNCDLVWPKERIILEYDSDIAHGNADQYAYDKIKYRSLTISDYKAIPIVRKDLKSLDNLDNLFLSIRVDLGMRKELARFNKYRFQRESVYKDLFRSQEKNNQES